MLTFCHHKSSSQCIDTWQPTDREDTMPSWTEPTLDQLITRFNASKSINYATPKWNNRIYLTPNLVEIKTHVSTLHSVIRKQLSEIGQSIEWHFNAQPCRCSNPLRHSTQKSHQAHKPPIPSCATWASAAVILNLTKLTQIITLISLRRSNLDDFKGKMGFQSKVLEWPRESQSEHI